MIGLLSFLFMATTLIKFRGGRSERSCVNAVIWADQKLRVGKHAVISALAQIDHSDSVLGMKSKFAISIDQSMLLFTTNVISQAVMGLGHEQMGDERAK